MLRYTFIIVLTLILALSAKAQNYFWIGFTDKNGTEYSLSAPEAYLSERSIERRIRQQIPIDSLDLPVNKNYIDSVLTTGVTLVHQSKWLNGITVAVSSGTLDTLTGWSFIREVQLTKPASVTKSAVQKFADEISVEEVSIDSAYYGEAVHQVSMLKGEFLHQKNFRGQGMVIAVLDGGFYKVNELPAFDSLRMDNRILGTRDFVDPNSDFYKTHYHGMEVLSCMGGNLPGQLIGTAPDASYWLLRSEDVLSEYLIEEDNWAAAAEFADSVGADVINSSLGYYTFYQSSMDHTYADMDGRTTRVTRAANTAASRGMLVFCSAGNERNDDWFRIIAPSDGEKVIGVGAVDVNLNPAYFTSAGPAYGGAIKPNVSAMGYLTAVQGTSGSVTLANGTSFSSPVLAGMVTCLWQMFPNKKATDLKQNLEYCSSQYDAPDSLVGYGIPNMEKAALLLGYQNVDETGSEPHWKVWPNPFFDHLTIEPIPMVKDNWSATLFSASGKRLKHWQNIGNQRLELTDIPALTTGIYFLRMESEESVETIKLNKIR